MIRCFTTMNKVYYDIIGKYMIDTWVKHAPSDYKLHLYLEDFSIVNLNDDRIVHESWNDVDILYKEWMKIHQTDKCLGFVLKALTQIVFFKKYTTGRALWLDADVVFLKKLPDNFFDYMLEDYPLASWGLYSLESGTVFVNLSHQDWPKIRDIYEDIYLGGKPLLPGERWFDGELLGRAVKDSGVLTQDLKRHVSLEKENPQTPINRSWIKNYMQHFKANRKSGQRFFDDLRSLGVLD